MARERLTNRMVTAASDPKKKKEKEEGLNRLGGEGGACRPHGVVCAVLGVLVVYPDLPGEVIARLEGPCSGAQHAVREGGCIDLEVVLPLDGRYYIRSGSSR